MSRTRAVFVALFLIAIAVPIALRGATAASAAAGGNGKGNKAGADVSIMATSYFDTKDRVANDRANNPASRYSPKTGSNLVNHGGPVMSTSVKVYLIYWGWAAAGDPSSSKPYVNGFFQSANGGSWLKSVIQYSSASNAYSVTAIGDDDVTRPVPVKPTSQDIANEAGYYALQNGTGPNILYIVLTPHGRSESGFATQWCGYHSYATFTSTGLRFAYSSVPYQPDAGYSCGASYGSANAGYSIVGGHELGEAITDVYLNAWYDRNGAENGDKCAWTNILTTAVSGYYTQPLWSNAANGGNGACVQTTS